MISLQKLRQYQRHKHSPADPSITDVNYSRWSNKDLDPVPGPDKKWEWYHVAGFWVVEGFSVAQIQTASATVALGLNPGLALAAMFLGNVLVAVACAGVGYIGSEHSINFPVIARASFGLWGSYLPIIIRAVVCPIWYGIIAYTGSLGVQAMIEAIWPSFQTWHINAFPSSADINGPGLLSFSIYWLLSLPFFFIRMPALRWFFLVKMCLMPLLGVSLFTWAVTAAKGFGPLIRLPNKIEDGKTLGYAFCYAITTAISACSTFAVNMPDITRYSRKPGDSALGQLICLPICLTLTYFLGVVLAASTEVVYGQVIWNPLVLVQLWDNRPAKFFVGLLFAFAAIGTNLAGNSIPFGNDITALFPRYMNLRRGQFLAAFLGFIICPWKIEASASRFLGFLNGYTIFLGPISGVLMCDYYLVRRLKGYDVKQLYRNGGTYWYRSGINLRALVAFLLGMVPQLPGLAYQINPSIGGISWNYLGFASLGWLDGLVFSAISYYALCLLYPVEVHSDSECSAV